MDDINLAPVVDRHHDPGHIDTPSHSHNHNTVKTGDVMASRRQNESKTPRELRTKVACGLDDTMTAIAIRAAVFSGEGEVPINKIIDGNDFCSAHIICYIGEIPVGSLRIRCFNNFARIERICVLRRHRSLPVINALTKAFFQYCSHKGYRTVTGSVRPDTFALWKRHGARVSGPMHQTVAGEMLPMVGDLPLEPGGPLLENAGTTAFEEAMAEFEGDCLNCL